ncbi:LysR family transcriptional regulator [Streptomyces sp. NRRL S-474]|uniref:LysR family transcriptional regulator n=1 Tax=Streptomyces sp. NRRL S-474 TaxID=1463909 RepID=UPI0004CA4AE2|nr:LysR family transcriptional regulator [Streptomyces sp. NRRL S-474]
MLDVRRLRLLRELCYRGTIAAVAQALSFTPSAVSQQLNILEREAGVPLLERTGRGVTLTPAGHRLVVHAEVVLERLELAASELVDLRTGPTGPVRIGAFPTAVRSLLPPVLTALAEHHPGLEPLISEIDPAGVAHALRVGELDVALLHEYDFVPSPTEPGLSSEPLLTEPMYLASPVTRDEVRSAQPVITRWRDASWITATSETLCHAMTIRACQAAGFTPRIRHQVDEFATVLLLVAAGQGVAMVPHLGIADAPPNVALTRLPIERRTVVAHRRGAAGHPAVEATVAALRTAVPPELVKEG